MFNDEKEIYDRYSNLIGRIVMYRNGDKMAYDAHGTLLGSYDHSFNITTKHPSGEIVAHCDAIMLFFPNADRIW